MVPDICTSNNPCQNGGRCANLANTLGYNCTCEKGYTGYKCQHNIDECIGNACTNGATCLDGIGNYTCQCPAGFDSKCIVYPISLLKDNSTMDKTEAQIVSHGTLYLNPSSHQCQPSYKKYIAVQTLPNKPKLEALGAAILAS